MVHAGLKKVVIVGGGTAGWLTAGIIAAEQPKGVEITLVESPDVSPIGVGEGTWPTMRTTLKKLGIDEADFIRECDASFKQGSRFANWTTGKGDFYYHPFALPQGYADTNLVPHWQQQSSHFAFADAVSSQSHLCELALAPKLNTMAQYTFAANYGYHLDATKFSNFLRHHCVTKLNVKHVVDHVTRVNGPIEGDITSVSTKQNGLIAGDLFIDCSGFSAILLGKHYEIPFISRKDVLFIDKALAVQVPYQTQDGPIASATLSTAQSNGWIWDIGLQSRRGVGHVYSSAHTTVDEAEEALRRYIKPSMGEAADSVDIRQLSFEPGHRQKFWHKNCVAVGMASGFLEPLEASAIVMVELSAKMIAEQLPANRAVMDIVSKRFNEKFLYRWDRVVDFLKLHYALTQRTDSDFWQDNTNAATIPDSLQELLTLWRYQSPWHQDFTQTDEIFSSASYQYILYGMGFETLSQRRLKNVEQAQRHFSENIKRSTGLSGAMPNNRSLIDKIIQYGLPKI
jgi:tryptophan halogenase